jgi:hypothetical protein
MSGVRGTSHAAGRAIRGRSATLRARVFGFILDKREFGATLEEIELGLAMSGNTVRPRRVELEDRKLVEDSGNRRPTRSGKPAIVWRIPELVAARAREKLAMRSSV